MRVGIAGLGTIGTAVARVLATEPIEGLSLEAITTRSDDKARATLASFDCQAFVVSPTEIADIVDVLVECAPKNAFREVTIPSLRAGRIVVTVSGAALLAHPDLPDLASQSGGRIIVASGAILGLDALRAAAEGTIHSVKMITRKPPRSLAGAPHLERLGIDVLQLNEATKVFEGSAREGAAGFPANVNVAAAVGLAGIGVDATRLEIWADPGVERNTHTVKVDADSARFELHIENVPSEHKPGTGKITALSVIATLRGLVSTVRVGT